jgi:hypothetical protein
MIFFLGIYGIGQLTCFVFYITKYNNNFNNYHLLVTYFNLLINVFAVKRLIFLIPL